MQNHNKGKYMLNLSDIQVTTSYPNGVRGKRLFNASFKHNPTGMFVNVEGYSGAEMRQRALKELESKVQGATP